MTITRNFKLCLNAGTQNAPYINANQYDEGEEWVFDLYTEGGQKFTPSTGAIIGIKSDGHAILNSGTVNSDGQVVITETQQMTAASGLAVFELLIEGETHGTANFIVNVERRPSDDAEFSDSDLSMLQEAIDAAEVINEILDEGGDPSEIIAENVNAWLDNHPEATTTVLDGAITAPKINNSLWDKLLVNEEASGNPASFDDGADDVPVSSLKVALELIQLGSGDPSPSNVRPIYPANGKNILNIPNMDTTFGALTVKSNNGVCVANGTATSGTTCTLLRMTGTLPAGEYILNGNANFTQQIVLQVYSYTRSSNIARCLSNADVTFTVNANEDIVVVLYVFSGQTLNNFTFYPMIRLAEITDTSYQPYQGIMVEQTGRNLLNMNIASGTYSGLTITANDDGSILANGTPTADLSFAKATGAYAPMLHKGVTYTVKGTRLPVSNCFLQLIYNGVESGTTYSLVNNNGNDYTITMTEDATFNNVYFTFKNGQTFTNWSFCPQLVVGTDTSENIPYIGNSYPYTLGQSVYGGTVDLATGVLTVDMGYFTLNGSETWTVDNNGARVVTTALRGQIKPNTGNSSTVEGDITNMFLQTTPNMTYGGDTGFSVATNGNIHVSDGSTMTVEGWQSFLASKPLTLAMKLVTPTTINLTPQEVKSLLGYNNISSTGTVDVIYHADTKLYIDKKIGELS